MDVRDLVERLRIGARYLPRVNTQSEYDTFVNMGDVIQVNEGDFWLLLMDAKQAADKLESLSARYAELEKALERVWLLSLVIESAVRYADEPNHAAIVNMLDIVQSATGHPPRSAREALKAKP